MACECGETHHWWPMQIRFPDGAVWFGTYGCFRFTYDPSQVPDIIEHPYLDATLVDAETLSVDVAWCAHDVWHGGTGRADRTLVRTWLSYFRPFSPPQDKPAWWVDDTDAVVRMLQRGGT